MRVVFDSQIFCFQRSGGISRYFASLAQEMAAMADVQPRIVAPVHINEHAAALSRRLVIGHKVSYSGRANVLLGMASSVAGALVQCALRPDIVHETYYYPQPRLPLRARRVITIHDLGYQMYPQYHKANSPLPGWMKSAITRADHIICVSEHTKRELLAIYDVSAELITVIHHGVVDLDALITEEDPASARVRFTGADRPYVLYVGSRAQYKNFSGLLRAFAASAPVREGFAIVCFGGGAFTAAEQQMMADLNLTGAVRQVAGSDSLLASCYRHAALFVYPSLYEGFGIPPLEAMSLDCPVICSNTTSIPEVVGDAALTFDPTDTHAIRSALETVLGSASLRENLVLRGRQRRKLFSWQRCALETVSVYQRLGASG